MKSKQIFKLAVLTLMPVTAWAVAWSMGGYSTPAAFKQAASALGLRVTQACRPHGTKYGAKNSRHLRCLAMDLGAETPKNKIAMLNKYGLCGYWHKKGFFGATANHWHVQQCSTAGSRSSANRDQRSRAKKIRANSQRGGGSYGSGRTSTSAAQ